MPIYEVTHKFSDLENGQTSKTYRGDFSDYAAARAAADALLVDAQAITEASLFEERLTEVNEVVSLATAGATVFERVSATVDLGGNKAANFTHPSPVSSIMAGNSLITTSTEWIAFTANFGPGLWTISDGENITGTIRGKRIYVRSGNTNLV